MADDALVAQIDDIAGEVLDVLDAWSAVWDHWRGNLSGITGPQRRLKWSLDSLPEQVRAALPLVEHFASADWRDDFFGGAEEQIALVDADLREELRSVRTQIAQGLPVTRRWMIDANLGEVSAGRRDASAYLWQIARGDETAVITVYISGTVMAAYDEALSREVAQAKQTNGRSAVISLLALDEPPREVMVATSGIGWPVTD